jgi:hypothetical protein
VVDDDCDVLVTFLIAGLVNADIYEVVKPSGTLRFYVIQRPVDAPADRFPVNAHILRDSTSGKIYRKPSDSEVKILCKAAAGISPRDISHKHSVFRAFNAVGMTLYLNKGAAPVKPSPYTWKTALGIIILTALMAEGAVILMPPVRPCLDPDMGNAILIGIAASTFYHCTLDI